MSDGKFTIGFLQRFIRSNGDVYSLKEDLHKQLISFLAHSPNIPTFPAIVRKIEKIIKSEKFTLEEIESTARLDPSLASQIIRSANASTYGGGSLVQLHDCLQRLGVKQLRKILCLHGTISSFYGFKVKANWSQFWHHSILTARFTELIYPYFAEESGDEYLAGLLHDSGKLFLQRIFPELFQEVIQIMAEENYDAETAEHKILGFTHSDVSANLCDRWELSPRCVEAVRWHHQPDHNPKAESRILSHVLQFADLCANAYDVNLDAVPKVSKQSLFDSPEWLALQSFKPSRKLEIDFDLEVKEVQILADSIT
ncbi:MAG: HDOD domain-containing protein [Verrucomicrobiota bacterium]